MKSYSYTSSSSSSSSSPSAQYNTTSFPREKMTSKPSPSFLSSLHSVRKPAAKLMKKPIAPLPPTPPRVYKVDSANFKAVVQRLTSVPEFQSRRLQDVAPPPLNLSRTTALRGSDSTAPLQLFPSPSKSPSSDTFRELMNETLETKPSKLSESLGALSPLGFGLSPSSLSWCSFALMSPGTLSALGQSTVL